MTTDTWAITFGLGSEHGKTYTAVVVPSAWPMERADALVRRAAIEHYGRAWAFHYPPERVESGVLAYGMTLRETIDLASEVLA